ncbi:hypothetical protein ALC56_08308 [Trachymyrmex septentrionalis]|uniref:Uncharacterized protein n=1 Tax=Trachymyrmex septentrionalis TaxID=34720 RepID=A0A195FA47_9HYME|nr:hypothetical protein ALC56_08308 [Trachymyrmex septentrionalis]
MQRSSMCALCSQRIAADRPESISPMWCQASKVEITRYRVLVIGAVLKSISLSFNVYDAAGSDAPGSTGTMESNRRIGMTWLDPEERATEPRSLQVFDRVLRG